MKIKQIYLPVALLACLAACSEDDTGNEVSLPGDVETALVKFETNANTAVSTAPLSRGITLPELTRENFRILAFKKSPANGTYLYAQDVPLDGMKLNQKVLSGTARLPIGEYKFISTYGLATDGGFALPALTPVTTELTDDLHIAHGAVDGSSVFFLEEGPLENLHSYALGIDSKDNEAVSATLSRAVSRVDVLFIQAKKDAEKDYTEVDDSADVFGVTQLAGIEMQFTGLNKNVNLVGKKTTTDPGSLFDNNFEITDLASAVTRGTSEGNTKVGTSDFTDYDHITGDVIKRGSAHVHGAYVLPFADSATTTTLKLRLTNRLGDERLIEVPGNLPLERNKVTLVRIYVLSGTVFNTDVQFNVTVDTAWMNAHTVDGEIK